MAKVVCAVCGKVMPTMVTKYFDGMGNAIAYAERTAGSYRVTVCLAHVNQASLVADKFIEDEQERIAERVAEEAAERWYEERNYVYDRAFEEHEREMWAIEDEMYAMRAYTNANY